MTESSTTGLREDLVADSVKRNQRMIFDAISKANPNALSGGDYIFLAQNKSTGTDDLPRLYFVCGSVADREKAIETVREMNERDKHRTYSLVRMVTEPIPLDEG